MDNATRLQYLQTMGIDVWVSRNSKQADVALSINENAWSILEKQVIDCIKCELCNTRTQTVFGTGNINAEWMFIGEAPGQQEDLAGQPFVGQTGKLLTEMIQAIGLTRESVYIANILKCRPPNSRDPKVEEINSCNQYIQRQIEWVKPKIIVAVGRVAAQALLKTNEPLSKLRGIAHQINDVPLVVVYHPAYLLRSLLEKRKAWQDLLLANEVYQKVKTL
ncbi:MAG: uracil-DNA glycosylase [Methylococcales symbiont of Hymedesmia sp. n. MRB-2018]|nr:MAG: uracil-DNA glycosylase [Methylococcales symbiont of Hymedesmia sp. n. MRB-2018]KAF3983052.1 MAG: uracil-DNA glycosylase [Methylococcales symbiont of Hymedesmia sp. n. MRB-2018]